MPGKKTDVDLDCVQGMAAKFCTQDEIALKLDFDKELFVKRKDVREAFERGRNLAKITVRTMLYEAAGSGEKQAVFFLAKNELGYRDYPPDAAPGAQVPKIIDDVEVADG